MERDADPRNAIGDLYVRAGECITCGAPEHEAPDLIRTEKDGCYFFKQPQADDESERAVRAVRVSCCGAVRYGGTDPAIAARIAEPKCDADRSKPRENERPWWKFK